jgi:16S rRNA (guanine966-N2)-methyltransferase
VRPTAEAVRDVWMTHLRGTLQDAQVLDLFAGSGALGLEALSRGAASADFVENGPSSLHALKSNVTSLRVRDRCRIFKRDAIPFVEALSAGAYDIAFADPPYGSRKLNRVLDRWHEMRFSRILCLEHAPDHEIGPGGSTLRFGETVVTIFGVSRARRRKGSQS